MQDKFPLTDNEKWIIEMLRTLKPFESVSLVADKSGKVNNFLVVRSTKVILTDLTPIYTS